ncbi:MAG: hypothetical protein ABSA79_08250 [Candidatus Bathyarchaeia archaeon]|jgi:hypothetical protein
MEKNKDKRLEEKEKLEAEIERSMSVVRMKQAHMEIEQAEKARKKPAIISIIDRIDTHCGLIYGVYQSLTELKKTSPNLFQVKVYEGLNDITGMSTLVKTFESIRYDLQRNIDIKDEDFDKLFPKLTLKFETGDNALTSMICLNVQMMDMKNYCKRLL